LSKLAESERRHRPQFELPHSRGIRFWGRRKTNAVYAEARLPITEGRAGRGNQFALRAGGSLFDQKELWCREEIHRIRLLIDLQSDLHRNLCEVRIEDFHDVLRKLGEFK